MARRSRQTVSRWLDGGSYGSAFTTSNRSADTWFGRRQLRLGVLKSTVATSYGYSTVVGRRHRSRLTFSDGRWRTTDRTTAATARRSRHVMVGSVGSAGKDCTMSVIGGQKRPSGSLSLVGRNCCIRVSKLASVLGGNKYRPACYSRFSQLENCVCTAASGLYLCHSRLAGPVSNIIWHLAWFETAGYCSECLEITRLWWK